MEQTMTTLQEVLDFREWKSSVQTEMLALDAQGIIVSLGMNIPGPIKCSSSILSAFREGITCLEKTIKQLGGRILKREIKETNAGSAAIYLVKNIEPFTLKRKTVEIENNHILGRLFDIDVLDQNKEAIMRNMVGASKRTCLLCEKDAKLCGRSRSHSVRELQNKTFDILKKWEKSVSEEIGLKAYKALLDEVYTTPKPGLVDLYSCGAHKDMTVESFEKSAEALKPYFIRMAEHGLCMDCEEEVLFQEIRKTGIEAETAMYAATDGVNTHKGLIFTLGIYCAAAGRCRKKYGIVTEELLQKVQKNMTGNILSKEMEELRKKEAKSHGEQNLKKYGTRGIRGEAIAGYPSIWKHAFLVLHQGMMEKRDYNLVRLQTLFTLMSFVEDSNILARQNPETLKAVHEQAAAFLKEGGAYAPENYQKLFAMDTEYIHKNISAGGCADLLAATIFMELILNDDK